MIQVTGLLLAVNSTALTAPNFDVNGDGKEEFSSSIHAGTFTMGSGLRLYFSIDKKTSKGNSMLLKQTFNKKNIRGVAFLFVLSFILTSPLDTFAIPTENVRVSDHADVVKSSLDFHQNTGHMFMVTQHTNYWRVHLSTDSGKTWQLTYEWHGTVTDTSVVIVDDFLYIAYTITSPAQSVYLRRCHVSDGLVDAAFGFQTIFDKGSDIKEISLVANADLNNDRLYCSAILADSTLVFFWGTHVDTTTVLWTELNTNVTDAASGLDSAYDININGNWFFISYISTAVNHPINVVSVNGDMFSNRTIETSYTGYPVDAHNRTAISVYENTVIVVYEYYNADKDGYGIRYGISYNDGSTWGFYYAQAASADHNYFMPDVTGRGGQGIEVVYSEQVDNGFDIVWSTGRTGYSNGSWSTPVQVNTQDVFSKPNTISWLPPLSTASSSYGYGYIEEGNGYLYITRSVIPGDINNDGTVDLKDVVQSLQIITGELLVNTNLNVAADIDEDGNIGLAEAIYGLQVVVNDID